MSWLNRYLKCVPIERTAEQHIGAEELADIIRDHIERIDLQIQDCDSVCVYTLEGSEDTVCSLSSLSSMSSIQYNIVYTTAGSPNATNGRQSVPSLPPVLR